ncbi:ester cyclase [Chitinophaga sp. RCC_12]|uniref:ester cyclase n=1 Tax=Chitinophaga sp. RCC_12 TaxID=3239226 RepID=UPI003523AC4F
MTDTITAINKAIVQRLYKEVLVNWNMSLVEEFVAPHFISHDWPEGSPSGPEAFRTYYSTVIRSVLPDARYEVDDLIAEGNRVVVRWRLLGTHQGNFLDIAPTGRLITLEGIAIYRLENNKLAERWVVTNLHRLLEKAKDTSSANVKQH